MRRVDAERGPAHVRISDGGHLRRGASACAVGGGIALLVCVAALVSTDASIGDLGLPLLAIAALNGVVLAGFGAAAASVWLGERRGIRQLFDGEIWAEWTISADEWHGITERLLEGDSSSAADRRFALLAAGVVGAVLAGAVIVVALAAMDAATRAVAIVVALLIPIGLVGLVAIQNVAGPRRTARLVADLRAVPSPRLWFGPDGAYHEAEGFTSLDTLSAVADRTKSRREIAFTVRVRIERQVGSDPTDLTVVFPVPRGHDADAAALVRRYRRERLSTA